MWVYLVPFRTRLCNNQAFSVRDGIRGRLPPNSTLREVPSPPFPSQKPLSLDTACAVDSQEGVLISPPFTDQASLLVSVLFIYFSFELFYT